MLTRKGVLVFVSRDCISRSLYGRCRSGNRDVVGHGCNGMNVYKDDAHFPFPSIRFKENTRDIIALREKEKGDWKLLCCEEKKALYRASFCQTFSEFQANTGLWKLILGSVFITTSFAFWAMMFNHFYVCEPLPISLSKYSQKQQLRRIIESRTNPIDGISSEWDYANDRWLHSLFTSIMGSCITTVSPDEVKDVSRLRRRYLFTLTLYTTRMNNGWQTEQLGKSK